MRHYIFGICGAGALEQALCLRRHHATGSHYDGFAEIGKPCRIRSENLHRVAPGHDSVVEASETKIDRCKHFPAAPVFWVILQIGFDTSNRVLDCGRNRLRRVHRNGDKVRRPQREIGNSCAQRQQNDGARERCRRMDVAVIQVQFGVFHRGDQTPGYFDPRRLGLYAANQACGLVAVDLIELVAINSNIGSRTERFLTACERPANRKHRRKCHQCENWPEHHLVTSGAPHRPRLGQMAIECPSIGNSP